METSSSLGKSSAQTSHGISSAPVGRLWWHWPESGWGCSHPCLHLPNSAAGSVWNGDPCRRDPVLKKKKRRETSQFCLFQLNNWGFNNQCDITPSSGSAHLFSHIRANVAPTLGHSAAWASRSATRISCRVTYFAGSFIYTPLIFWKKKEEKNTWVEFAWRGLHHWAPAHI